MRENMAPLRCQNCGQPLKSRKERHTYAYCRRRIAYLNRLEELLLQAMDAEDLSQLWALRELRTLIEINKERET